MVLGFFGGARELSVEDLIARKKYGKAAQALLARFRDGSRDPRLRMQLADVLILSGKTREAVPILVGLADEYALEGFAGKAIAILKKIEKIAPGRADVERKLAGLIEKKQAKAPTPEPAPAPPPPEIGIEEIGMVQATPQPPPVAGPETVAEEIVEEDLLGELENALRAPAPARREVPLPVASPLFSDFSQEELLAVIRGLELTSFEPGDLIITEGEPGDSLFVLTTGVARAFVRSSEGRSVKVRDMAEGSFFGEISILTGSPRTATVTAATACEALVLDRPTLDAIAERHPRVREVLREFYEQRAGGR